MVCGPVVWLAAPPAGRSQREAVGVGKTGRTRRIGARELAACRSGQGGPSSSHEGGIFSRGAGLGRAPSPAALGRVQEGLQRARQALGLVVVQHVAAVGQGGAPALGHGLQAR